MLVMRLKVRALKMTAICAHAPTDVSSEYSKKRFYHILDCTIKNMKVKHPSFKLVIGGDMNATIGNDCVGMWQSLGPNNDDLVTNGNAM